MTRFCIPTKRIASPLAIIIIESSGSISTSRKVPSVERAISPKTPVFISVTLSGIIWMVVSRTPECRAAELCLRTPPRPRHRGPNDVNSAFDFSTSYPNCGRVSSQPSGTWSPRHFPRSPFFHPAVSPFQAAYSRVA
jgi:hypothetical protein